MKKKFRLSALIIPVLIWHSLEGMTFDNRFLPLYLKPFVRRPGTFGHLQVQPLFMRSERAQGDFEESSIPDIDGKYDQVEIAKALEKSGRVTTDPFRSDLQGLTSIGWRREGHISAEGAAFSYEQLLSSFCGFNFSAGTSFLFLHVDSGQEFCLGETNLDVLAGDKQYLYSLKGRMHSLLGVTPALYHKTSFGDFDFYLRLARSWQYFCKIRTIDASIKAGFIAPTAPRTPINNPAAIPVGGEKHWGAYLGLESMLELKEDWFVGLMFRASKRFKRTCIDRMPVVLEPSRYGAVVGPLEVNPGWTFVFNPSVRFEALREGFGLTALYTLVAHLEDKLTDRRTAGNRCVAVNLEPVERRSSWGMEHVTIGAFYDFARYSDCRSWLPTVSVYWDIPVDWLVSKRSSKTNSVSIMIEADF